VLGRKRHILTDTLGLLLAVSVHPASVQDRDGAEALLREARRSFPFIERIIGDAGYQGRKMDAAVARTGTWKLQNRPPLRSAPLHRAPKALGRRADTGVDQPLPSARPRLRAPRPQSRRVRPPRHDPPHAAPSHGKPLITILNFPERL
jgi:transposase